MSWTNELYQVYESISKRQRTQEYSGDDRLLPLSHSTANAQIEVTLKEDGRFSHARALTKVEGKDTLIPVTEDSATRSSGIAPMPLADKLIYIAGDFPQFAIGKRTDNSAYYRAYMEQLQRWSESEYSHSAVQAIYAYLSQQTLMQDLVDSHVLQIDEETGKLLENTNIAGIAQEDCFIRFCIQYKDLMRVSETWRDCSLQNAFIAWCAATEEGVGLCYATGEWKPITYKHPSKIRNSGDKAKLISSNDESGYTYRGRFLNKGEAISVSYEFSQKMHNALKWLIGRQSIKGLDSMTIIIWASAVQELPDITEPLPIYDDDDEPMPFMDEADTIKEYCEQVKKQIFGYQDKMELGSKVMVMGLDAATTGRLSIAMYSELEHSVFFENLQRWHEDTVCMRYIAQKKRQCCQSFSLYEIIRCAYGLESNGLLECKKEVTQEQMLRLIPSVFEGRKLPVDLFHTLCRRASNPLAYEEKRQNHRKVIEVTCGMMRKHYIDFGKGVLSMSYDANETDRSYLYGCLLAIADVAERAAYDEGEDKRVTNAKRYWSAFVSRPCQTWEHIHSNLEPYLQKLGAKRSGYYVKCMDEVMSKFTPASFADQSALSPLYLLGYHHYHAEFYRPKKTNDENKED